MESVYNFEFFEQSLAMLRVVLISADEIIKQKPHIGEGSLGKVYKGIYNGNTVVIKKLKINDDQNVLTDILGDIKLFLAVIEDKGIPKFYGLWKKKNLYHLVFEYVDGIPLNNSLYSELTKQQKVIMIKEICETLQPLHEKRLIYRNLKPSSVIVHKDLKISLIDFGVEFISRRTNNFRNHYICNYNPPEMYDIELDDNFNNVTLMTTKADIWSLGCIILEIFSGKRPWWNLKNEMTICRKLMLKTTLPIPENIDEDIKEIIQKMTNVNPSERPSIQEVKEMLEQIYKINYEY
jgi:mitogen-activated protein kinase kinase kinase